MPRLLHINTNMTINLHDLSTGITDDWRTGTGLGVHIICHHQRGWHWRGHGQDRLYEDTILHLYTTDIGTRPFCQQCTNRQCQRMDPPI